MVTGGKNFPTDGSNRPIAIVSGGKIVNSDGTHYWWPDEESDPAKDQRVLGEGWIDWLKRDDTDRVSQPGVITLSLGGAYVPSARISHGD